LTAEFDGATAGLETGKAEPLLFQVVLQKSEKVYVIFNQ
jgi:hypothetical protein